MTAITPATAIPAQTAAILHLVRDESIRAIGFWRDRVDQADPHAGGPYARLDQMDKAAAWASLPWPGDHIDQSMTEAERAEVAALLDSAPLVVEYMGFSNDRLDPESKTWNGSCERRAGGYQWPEGLTLYVRKYGLRLDPVFLAAVREAMEATEGGCDEFPGFG